MDLVNDTFGDPLRGLVTDEERACLQRSLETDVPCKCRHKATGFLCTRYPEHFGRHIASDIFGTICAIWEDDNAKAK